MKLNNFSLCSYSSVSLTLTFTTNFQLGVYNLQSYLWHTGRFHQFGFHKCSINGNRTWPAFNISIESCRGGWDKSVNGFSKSMLIWRNKLFSMNWLDVYVQIVAIYFPFISLFMKSGPAGHFFHYFEFTYSI